MLSLSFGYSVILLYAHVAPPFYKLLARNINTTYGSSLGLITYTVCNVERSSQEVVYKEMQYNRAKDKIRKCSVNYDA